MVLLRKCTSTLLLSQDMPDSRACQSVHAACAVDCLRRLSTLTSARRAGTEVEQERQAESRDPGVAAASAVLAAVFTLLGIFVYAAPGQVRKPASYPDSYSTLLCYVPTCCSACTGVLGLQNSYSTVCEPACGSEDAAAFQTNSDISHCLWQCEFFVICSW